MFLSIFDSSRRSPPWGADFHGLAGLKEILDQGMFNDPHPRVLCHVLLSRSFFQSAFAICESVCRVSYAFRVPRQFLYLSDVFAVTLFPLVCFVFFLFRLSSPKSAMEIGHQ